jgi:hypothetical protein
MSRIFQSHRDYGYPSFSLPFIMEGGFMPDFRYRITLPPQVVARRDTFTGYDSGWSNQPTWSHFEEITDQINPIRYGLDNHRPPGPCVHNKCVVTDASGLMSYVAGNGDTVNMYGWARANLDHMYPKYSPRNYVWFNGWLNLLAKFEETSTYQNLCVEAFNKQISQVPTKTSVINFAIELAELKPIFKSLASIPKHIREGTLSKQVTGRGLSRRTPINVAKGGAKAFLAAEFGWLPFVSDIIAFIGTMDAITKRLDYLRKTKGKETTVHFEKLDAYVHPQLGQTLTSDTTSDIESSVVLMDHRVEFHSTWKLFQDLQGLDDAWAGLRAAFAYLGVNNPAKIVWNAIPYSFLVDWVTPVSSWLDRVAVQPFAGEWRVYDVTSSVKETSKFQFNTTALRGGTSGPQIYMDVKCFRRLPYLPLTLGAVDFSQLSDTQQKLALALVVTRR